MNVLVTGGSGYLGKTLIRQLSGESGVVVHALARSWKGPAISAQVCQLHGDLTDLQSLREAFQGQERFDVVYHLAAATSGSHYEGLMNSVVGTENLFAALEGITVGRFVLVSSFSVYKLSTLKPWATLDERCPVEDNLPLRDSYTITKTRQEKVVFDRCARRNLPLVVLRPGKIYGPGTDVIPPQLGLRIPGICFLCMGGGHLLPLTHVENTAEAIRIAGTVPGLTSEVINIVDDDLPTQREFLKMHKRYLGLITRLVRVPYWAFRLIVRGFEKGTRVSQGNIPPIVTRYRAANLWMPLRYDNSYAKKLLGWTPAISPASGLQEVFEGLPREAGKQAPQGR
ncbi:MAG: NAD-dependent epimerase/dehydratase family protein [Candidatus Geothermincolia bacterium]